MVGKPEYYFFSLKLLSNSESHTIAVTNALSNNYKSQYWASNMNIYLCEYGYTNKTGIISLTAVVPNFDTGYKTKPHLPVNDILTDITDRVKNKAGVIHRPMVHSGA